MQSLWKNVSYFRSRMFFVKYFLQVVWFGLVYGFYSISTSVGYLKPNLFLY